MTPLSLDDVVALNALIVTAIGLSLAFGRRDRRPPRLNLSGPRRATAYDEIPPDLRVNRLQKDQQNDRPGMVAMANNEAARSAAYRASGNLYGANALKRLEEEEHGRDHGHDHGPGTPRQLNVFFNWNGHTWDAYEVLGIPAGAGRETVVQAFHACRTKSPDSTAFLQAATDAILKGARSRS